MKLFVVAALAYYALGQKGVLSKLPGRIVGGSAVNISDYPYQVSLEYTGSHICGGVIITPDYILTAAHCLQRVITLVLLSVRVGSTKCETGGQLYKVSSALAHPDYSRLTIDYDIGILKLDSTISTANAKPIPIPSTDVGPADTSMAVVTGWGDTTEGGSLANHLQMVQIPVINRTDCRSAYSEIRNITERMICAGYSGEGSKGPCNGDSGGPLVVNGVLYGLVSWSRGCARPEYPAVFTNVAALRGWVIDNIKGSVRK